jgi:hypothetical protein
MKREFTTGYAFLIRKINSYTKTQDYKDLSKDDRKEIKEVEVYLFNLAVHSGELEVSEYHN